MKIGRDVPAVLPLPVVSSKSHATVVLHEFGSAGYLARGKVDLDVRRGSGQGLHRGRIGRRRRGRSRLWPTTRRQTTRVRQLQTDAQQIATALAHRDHARVVRRDHRGERHDLGIEALDHQLVVANLWKEKCGSWDMAAFFQLFEIFQAFRMNFSILYKFELLKFFIKIGTI